VFGGDLAGGAEKWSCGIATEPPTELAVEDRQAWIDAAAQFVKDELFTGGFASNFGNATTYNTASWFGYDADGNQVERWDASGSGWHGAGGFSTNMPTEVAVCDSLLTPFAGRRGRGRIYLGGLSTGVLAASGRLDATKAQDLANAVSGLCEDINGIAGGVHAMVYSAADGDLKHITNVQVGDVFDSQRRRRFSLFEARYSSPVS